MPKQQRSSGEHGKAPAFSSFKGDSFSSNEDTVLTSEPVAQSLRDILIKEVMILRPLGACIWHIALGADV